eukprot:scaffold119879_cov28-Tisochrysis_lutea.AAC.4
MCPIRHGSATSRIAHASYNQWRNKGRDTPDGSGVCAPCAPPLGPSPAVLHLFPSAPPQEKKKKEKEVEVEERRRREEADANERRQ